MRRHADARTAVFSNFIEAPAMRDKIVGVETINHPSDAQRVAVRAMLRGQGPDAVPALTRPLLRSGDP